MPNQNNRVTELKEVIQKANPNIVSKSHESIGNNLRCKNCGESDSYDNRNNCKKGISRPIRLADVLLTVDPTKYGSESNNVSNVIDLWDWQKDDLDNQSEETINFLYELLCKQENK